MRTLTLRCALIAAVAVTLVTGCSSPNVRSLPVAHAVGPRAPETEAEQQELSFLIGMAPHHGQAVDIGKICTKRAHDQRLVQMCHDIIRVQSREIQQMSTWALEWYGTQLSTIESALHAGEGASGSHGILRDEQMHDLNNVSGRRFDRRFVAAMIEHHRGAIASAEGLLAASPHPEVRQLASDILSSQQDEVDRMRRWRRHWTSG